MFLRNWARLYSRPTVPESRLESAIAKLGKPYRAQHPFFGIRRIVDFALLDDRIVIEVDGASHDTAPQIYKDITSTVALERAGWAVIRFRNGEVMDDPVGCTQRIAEMVKCRPTLLELEARLRDLDPGPVVKRAKRRVRKPKPAPKKAQKRPAPQ